jgi:tRNA(fMet)-specific endonuclease VapC
MQYILVMQYILDIHICIYIIKKKPAKVLEHFKSLILEEVGVSSTTIGESEYGISKSQGREQAIAIPSPLN